MSAINNNKKKRDIRYESHNRRPGIAKYWKRLNHRKNRRRSNRVNYHFTKDPR